MTYTLEELKQMMREDAGNLNLNHTQITSLPDGLTVRGDLDLEGTPITSLPDNLTVGGCLYLHKTKITSLPNNLAVEGNIFLDGTPITSLPNHFTVGCGLFLDYTPITSLPKNLTIGGDLFLSHTQITSLPDDLIVGGTLDISHTQITSLPDNLTVGGSLWLSGTPISSLPKNLTVGYCLDVEYTPITSLPDNLAVGGMIISNAYKIKNSGHYKLLQNGDYVEGKYLFADGILTHVKRAKKIGEYTFCIGKIPDTHVVFDGKYYAHCTTFREGVRDIEFKRASDRGAEQYRSLTLDSKVSKDEAITMYRVITGACQRGAELFVNSLETTKNKYTVKEIISITQGQYGSRSFTEFFEREN